MSDAPQVQAIALVWYHEKNYDQLKAMFEDGDNLPRTFLQWQDKAEQGRKKFSREGKKVIKAYIDPETFPKWCAANGHRIDAAGRTAFANAEAYRVFMKM
ncbi:MULTISPECIES: hypothetical protein [unclassified Duganella]|uniref:hypothetical protein n=1 Tax=unclassified Duganella TaxID=2636909 RepID=UPI0008867C90|nr:MULTISPECIES: hypothetical protein [unclassified Duganella]SDH41433.1 hypothetical protein SAMN05216320_11319 [Duganella sp. OV458]SDK60882.1 hypothetical protein SAMN05428973_113144 [Duganella sp. OV510]